MSDRLMLFGIGEDMESGLTLGQLHARIAGAVRDGFPVDEPLKYGYLPEWLRDCAYVEKPVDLTRMPVKDLVIEAKKIHPAGMQREAWAEIERRLEAFGLAGED